MTTPSPTLGMSVLHAAQLLAGHLDEYPLPASSSVMLTTRRATHSQVTVQLRSATLAEIAADLLSWAESLSAVTAGVWHPPGCDWVHLSITTTLTGHAGVVGLEVFGGTDDNPIQLADLEPGQRRSVSLGELRTWATNALTGAEGGESV